MKYFVLELSEMKADGKTTKAVYEFDTLDQAVASFHTKMGTAMKSSLYASELVMVINSDGGVHKKEKWTAPVKEEAAE